MNIKLPQRLACIAAQVTVGNRVADIGTDHGYLPIYLVQNSIAPKVIACDVNQMPLESAQRNIALYGCSQQIETRLSDGLRGLSPGEVDTVVIAGMGGLLIQDILEASKEIAHNVQLILQPMQGRPELRKYLVANGYQIQRDLLVEEEHRIYEVLVVGRGTQEVTREIEYEVGFHLKDNPRPIAEKFIKGKILATKGILTQMKDTSNPLTRKRMAEYEERLQSLEEVLTWLLE